jgi:hypothetical protein
MKTRAMIKAGILLPTCVALAAGALGGCSAYKDPTLSVAAVRVAETTPTGVVLEFTLDATNPNEEPLPLREFNYALALDGRPVFTGFRSPEATLRRFGTQRLTLPVAISLAEGQAAPTGTFRYALRGELGYTTPGEIAEILFDSGLRRPTVPFNATGTLNLSAGEAQLVTE